MEWNALNFFLAYVLVSSMCGLFLLTNINFFLGTERTIDSTHLLVRFVSKYLIFSFCYFFSIILTVLLLSFADGILSNFTWYSDHTKIVIPVLAIIPAVVLCRVLLRMLRWVQQKKAASTTT